MFDVLHCLTLILTFYMRQISQGNTLFLVHFEDAIIFLNRISVRAVNDLTANTFLNLRYPTMSQHVDDTVGVVSPRGDVQANSSLHKVFVRSNAESMYGKMMRHIHIANYKVESDYIVRFRASDGKVVLADLMTAVGRYSSVGNAHKYLKKLLNRRDAVLDGLKSLEMDDMLLEGANEVSIQFPCMYMEIQ